ncbi:Sir2 family NAD-dependent protein deacetylase [Selenomonas ruminis]|uniref:Uncharacterized protein n=1 Tax=Selenomonas ruminis TaxID=2593411 RepID=A0A5D6W7Y5_9FIRM|nr:hypothetical protein FZ040_06895 [Selenomonas sp. mPRGC5]
MYNQKLNRRFRPGVVLYEEGLDDDVVQKALQVISAANTLIVGGTSLVVYPAAGMIDFFRGRSIVRKENNSQTTRIRSSAPSMGER